MKKINRRSFLAVCGAAAAAGALAACGGSSSSSTAASTASSASSTASSVASSAAEATNDLSSLSGTVATGGSTSMNSVIEALTEGFAEVAPGVTISYDPTGSGAGITGAVEQTLDIGLASRALHDDETGVTATTVALDGIAMVVNNENTVSDLSIDQLAQIFRKEITNWADVGGEDGEIVVIGREAGSGTRDGFESITGTEDTCVLAQELNSTGAVIEAVRTTPGAIGYASLSAVEDQEGITVLTVGGVAPSEETVLDGTYAIQRPFVFATRTDEALSDAAQAFFDWATSEDANSLIESAGAVPVAGTDAASAA